MDIFSQYSSNRSQIDLEKSRIYFQIVTTPAMYPTDTSVKWNPKQLNVILTIQDCFWNILKRLYSQFKKKFTFSNHSNFLKSFLNIFSMMLFFWDIFSRNKILFLTHWGRVTHTCDGKLAIIVSDYDLSPGWSQSIIWTKVRISVNRTLGTNFSEILSEIHTFSFKKMYLKMSSSRWRPFCPSLNVLR